MIEFKTGDKVLTFQRTGVKVEWVADGVDMITNRVRTTPNESDLTTGGDWKNRQMVLPFSEEIWTACQDWAKRRFDFLLQLDREMAALQKGKIL